MSLNFHKLTILHVYEQYTGWSILGIIWGQLNVAEFSYVNNFTRAWTVYRVVYFRYYLRTVKCSYKTAAFLTVELSYLNDLPGLISFCFVRNFVEVLLEVCGMYCSLCHLPACNLLVTWFNNQKNSYCCYRVYLFFGLLWFYGNRRLFM